MSGWRREKETRKKKRQHSLIPGVGHDGFSPPSFKYCKHVRYGSSPLFVGLLYMSFESCLFMLPPPPLPHHTIAPPFPVGRWHGGSSSRPPRCSGHLGLADAGLVPLVPPVHGGGAHVLLPLLGGVQLLAQAREGVHLDDHLARRLHLVDQRLLLRRGLALLPAQLGQHLVRLHGLGQRVGDQVHAVRGVRRDKDVLAQLRAHGRVRGDQPGHLRGELVPGPRVALARGECHALQQPAHGPDGEVGRDALKGLLDVAQDVLHGKVHQLVRACHGVLAVIP
mmetsp:Transcript_15142/g.26760  ORF Transcript_15142/g.26760 Transcript_15142/m.26760 type:complete len:280 (+) Transcript_15142:328-1167(+)